MKFLEKNKATLLRLFGLAIFIITCVGLYKSQITWVWEGLVACSVSVLLVWMPEAIAKLILGIVDKLTTKLLGNGTRKDGEVL